MTIGYAMANRSAVVRIPAYAKAPKNKRFELRNPDATCNPYYAFAAILMAGLDGIQKQIDPHERGWGPYDFNLYTLSEKDKAQIDSLPKSLEEALDAWRPTTITSPRAACSPSAHRDLDRPETGRVGGTAPPAHPGRVCFVL